MSLKKTEKAMIADDGKPGKSLKETSTEELKATLAKLKPTDPGAEARIKALKAELSSRGDGGMEKAKQPSESSSLTPEKARQMLHERSGGHGRPITEQQRKFFGAVGGHLPAPGSKTKKSMPYEDLDDFLEKARYISRKRVGNRWVYTYPEDKKKPSAGSAGGGAGGGGGGGGIDEQQAQVLVNQAQAQVGGTGTAVTFPDDAGAAKKMLDGMPDGAVVARHDRSGMAQVTMAKVAGKWVTAQADTASDDWGDDDDFDVKHAFSADEMSKIVSRGQSWKNGVVWTPKSSNVQKSMEKNMGLEDWMEKAKYTSRKRVGNRWVYTYADDKKKKEGGGEGKKIKTTPVPESLQAKESPKPTVDVMHEVKTIQGSGSGNPKQFASAAQRMADKAFGQGDQKEYVRQMQRAAIADVVGKPEYSQSGHTVGSYKPIEEKMMAHATENAGRAAESAMEAWEHAEEFGTKKPGHAYDYSKKSMESLEDYIQKSGGLPTHQQGMGHKKSNAIEGGSADGGEVAGVGMTSGSSDSATGPGQDSAGQIKGTSTGKQKLSEDDAEDEKQMSTHKKPIETIKKSAFPADQRDTVARERAAEVSRLQKSDDVYIGPNAHPLGHHQTHASGDAEASELVKSEGFYQGASPTMASLRPMIEQGVLCKSVNSHGCDTTYSAALTSCPECGAGTVGHRHVPNGPIVGSRTEILEKSVGPGPLLRRPVEEPDIKIG